MPAFSTATVLAMASIALAAATSAAGYMQSSAQASAQRAQNEQQAELNRRQVESANAAYANDIAQVQFRARQEQEAAGQKLAESRRATLEAVSRERVSQGEAGVSGISLEHLIAGLEADGYNAETMIRTNARNTQLQLDEEMKGVHATAASRINGITPLRPVVGPSLLVAGVNFAGGALNAYDRYQRTATDKLKIPVDERRGR